MLGIILSIWSYQLANADGTARDITRIKSQLLSELRKIEKTLFNFPTLSDEEVRLLEKSNWYINILKSDSLVYWNQIDRSELTSVSNGFKGISKEINEEYTIRLSPNIYDINRKVKFDILSDLNLDNRLRLPNTMSIDNVDSIDYLESTNTRFSRYIGFLRYLLFLLSFIGALHLIYLYCRDINGPLRSLVVHGSISFSLLMIMQLIDLQRFFHPLIVFQNIHNSSFWVSSLAELILLNIVLGYLVKHLSLKLKSITFAHKYNPLSFLLASGVLSSGLFYLCHIASGIIRHPNIHLDIDNILLFDKYSFIVIILLLVYKLLIFTATCSIVYMASKGNKSNKVIYYCLGVLFSTAVYYFLGIHLPFWMLLTYLIVYLLMLDLFIEHRSNSIIWLIWWMVIFASLMAGIVFYNSLQEDIQERKQYVQNLYQSADTSDIYIISSLNEDIMSSAIFSTMSQLRQGNFQREDLNEYIRQSIPFEEKLDNKKMQIECYDSNQNSLLNTYGIPHDQMKSQLDRSIAVNQYIKYNPYKQTYYLEYLVNNDFHENAPFQFVIVLNPAKNQLIKAHDKHNYYVTQNDEIILKEDRNMQELQLIEIASIKSDTIMNGYSFVTSKVTKDIRIINYKRISSLIKPISLFSYIFSILGVIIIFISMINSRWNFLSAPLDIQLYAKDSLRTKIQLVIIVLVVFSFLIIGLMTGYYFNNLLKNNESKSYREQIISINNSIQSYVNNAIDEESKILVLSKSLNKITDIHGQEISLYSRAGKLISFTEIHEDMLRLPAGYSEIKLQTRDIEFKGVPKTIVPLSIASQPPYAYFTITFPKSPRSYSSILDFISTILNVYVFLFLIAGAIALAIANSITRPLSIIAGKLKEFKLGASNKPLIYEDNDEIGQLINEYNNLIVQVQDSADIIAKTERDMAWREMAKQVAHEIKNPLTPMKLSIQYLDKMVKTNPDRAKDLTEKVASTLVTQIDALTNIANEFSNYATMPKANNEKIILNEIVEAVHDLFRKRDDMDITMSEPIADLLVFVDRNQLIRILNNLVKNAIQAIPDDRRGKIDIALNKKNHSAIITVKDNGTGIPDYMKQKVFTPNFTTKNSGTGLGLAISANMIDSMNGRIYFDTRIYEGTTFFVEIPLMRTEQKPKESGTRVSLDD
ncbi:MAG: hypothetical protein CMN33_05560 [Saprospirales bacterium]|nr:hypothetical protein [Saprospirales bacterium]